MKILINAYPRCGSTSFAHSLRQSVFELRTENLEDFAEFDNWIVNYHAPFVNFGFYGKDVVQTTILRDPIDAISSNVERWFKGFTGNTIKGIQIVDNSQNRIDLIKDIKEEHLDFIKHQVDVYNSYLLCLEKNIDNIICFTYTQTREETYICIKNLLTLSGFDFNIIDQNNIVKTIVNREDKHPIYYQVRELLMAQKGLYDVYSRVLEQAIVNQKSLPFKFNNVV